VRRRRVEGDDVGFVTGRHEEASGLVGRGGRRQEARERRVLEGPLSGPRADVEARPGSALNEPPSLELRASSERGRRTDAQARAQVAYRGKALPRSEAAAGDHGGKPVGYLDESPRSSGTHRPPGHDTENRRRHPSGDPCDNERDASDLRATPVQLCKALACDNCGPRVDRRRGLLVVVLPEPGRVEQLRRLFGGGLLHGGVRPRSRHAGGMLTGAALGTPDPGGRDVIQQRGRATVHPELWRL
jgi:hypothetical protein